MLSICDCASGLVMPKKRSSTKTTNSIGVWSSFSSTTSQRWRFINVFTPCPQFDSKEMTMAPTEWLILTVTTSVVVIVFGVWFHAQLEQFAMDLGWSFRKGQLAARQLASLFCMGQAWKIATVANLTHRRKIASSRKI